MQRYGDSTVYMDLSHNCLKDLSWLGDFEQLRSLVLDSNRLHEAQLRTLNVPMPQLEVLMLNKNEVSFDINRNIHVEINSSFYLMTVQRSSNYNKTFKTIISQPAVSEPAR